ncbi:ent-kaurenoic acid monooxygenase [Ranunculus cassubicifolius]
MYGNPTVLITVPELCKQVLMDDERFKPGWPQATMDLAGRKSFIGLSYEEHKRLRKLTAAPITGHRALSQYLQYIEDAVVTALEKWSNRGELEFLPQLRKLTFKVIMHIFLSGESEHLMEDLEKEYTKLNNGLRAMKINLPGFAYYNAFKGRKRLVETFQSIVNERKGRRCGVSTRKDMMDELMDLEDENGIKLDDEEIIDVLLMYLNAGHESSGHITMWATVFLQEHPDIFQKAKAEQEDIVRNRPPAQKGLILKEVRQMEFLSKVIDETMRLVNFTVTVFREAKEDVNMNGYLIPKGWKINIWLRNVHLDPENYPDPKTFDPSRFDGHAIKPGTYLVFGAGGRYCPGKDLTKLEISVFLHYFLLNYQLERLNPKCSTQYLPHPKPTDNCLARIRRS